MLSPRSPAGLLLVPFALAACAVLGGNRTTLSSHMGAHMAQAEEMKTAVVGGHLEATRDPARWLAEHEEHPGLPHGVMSPAEDMRAFARQVVRAAALSDAARATGEAAAACGRCHDATGQGPSFGSGSMPPTAGSTEARMNRHDWAVERMWEGIVGPSDLLWEMGARALTQDPLTLPGAVDPKVAVIAREVHDLATTAQAATSDHRGAILGKMLVTCAQCHTLLGVPIDQDRPASD